MHTHRTDTAGPEGEILKVSGKKVYHSADRTGDARCPCNACEIARISCSNPKKIPRRPHYYRAAAGQRPVNVTFSVIGPKCGQIYRGKFKM